jgi:hypothetical protein
VTGRTGAAPDHELLRRFVATFEVLGDLTIVGEPDASELARADAASAATPLIRPPAHPDGWPEWRPIPADHHRMRVIPSMVM